MPVALKVAVIGASGIGLHHARWHHLSGSDVVAFVGTSKESCEQTQGRLEADFGFSGRAYTDVAHMLATEQPDVVDVSSPFQLHREHVIMALEAGCHVVCEKPLCWDMSKDLDEILADGKAVIDAMERTGKSLVMSAQYPAALSIYRELYTKVVGDWGPVESIEMEMDIKGRKHPRSFEDIWVDRASHPLSLAIALCPDGVVDWDSVSCVIGKRENRAQFEMTTPNGKCEVKFVLRDLDEGVNLRRFGVNGFLVDWDGFADDDGIYRARLTRQGESVLCNDFMHILIDEFGQYLRGEGGQVAVSGEDALKNLQYQIELLKRADRPV